MKNEGFKMTAFIMRMFGLKKISDFQEYAIPLQLSDDGNGLEVKPGALFNNKTVNSQLQAAEKMRKTR